MGVSAELGGESGDVEELRWLCACDMESARVVVGWSSGDGWCGRGAMKLIWFPRRSY